MSVTNVYTLYACKINAVVLPITQASISPGLNLQLSGVNGTVNPTMVHISSARQSVQFTTTNIKAGLDLVVTPLTPLSITTADFYFQPVTALATRGATNFLSFKATKGLLVPRPINATHPQAGTMAFEFFPISTDGAALPFTVSATTASPSLSTVSGDLWTVGPVGINAVPSSTLYTGVQSFVFDPGISLLQIGGDGEVFETFIAVNEVKPTFTIGFADSTVLTDITIMGTAQGATDSELYLRKIDPSGTRVAAITAQHISFVIDDGILTSPSISGSHGQGVQGQLLITPIFDGTAAQVVMNTATAIP